MRTAVPVRARLCMLLLGVFLFAPLAPVRGAEPGPGKGLAAVLQPFVDRHEVAGAVVLVADKDRVLALESVGYADLAAKRPLKTDALFWIASQSNPITAAALMMLVDEGKVKLDDPAEKYLPELKEVRFNGARPKTPITVRMLLSHTSGMPFKSAAETPTLDGLTLKDAIASYAKTPLQSEPGTKYSYSNAGINTAGRIIEVVSGMPYEQFLDTRLFGPLGMKDTTFWPSDEQLARLAKAYKPTRDKKDLEETQIGQLRYPLTDRKRQPMPAGGLFSTATDVARFCQMLLNGGTFQGKRLLSEAAVQEMTTRQTGAALKDMYGLGLSVAGGAFGHGGAFATNMTVDPKRGLITVFMVQHQGFPGDGGKAGGVFRGAALEQFGKPAK
jgi:CubicO group peptidase (beta-lactamase class C family)